MRIHLHVGLEKCGTTSLQFALARNRLALARQGILFPIAPGKRNHARLAMVSTDPDKPDNLRIERGLESPDDQARARQTLIENLQAEIAEARPDRMILSNEHCSSRLLSEPEITRLRDLCHSFSDDVLVHVYIREQASLLASIYSTQVRSGRVRSLEEDIFAVGSDWWDASQRSFALYGRHGRRIAPEIQIAPAWLDFDRLLGMWERVFGMANIRLHPFAPEHLAEGDLVKDAFLEFGIDGTGFKTIGRQNVSLDFRNSDRLRQCNAQLLLRGANATLLATKVRNAIALDLEKANGRTDPGLLAFIRNCFRDSNQKLLDRYREFPRGLLATGERSDPQMNPILSETDYDAEKVTSDALLALDGRESRRASMRSITTDPPDGVWPVSRQMGFDRPPKDGTGIVLVATMRDEGPFLLEWLAHHRSIGVDNFLIFTNDCLDGTDRILDRLEEMGLVVHIRNQVEPGSIPHQMALNLARNHPLVRKSSRIIHIDADEFINIHVGDGTLPELVAEIGPESFLAMTWRLFGSNGIVGFEDRTVVEQFVRSAPAFMPKPHTAWGFKAMYPNVGAYRKLGVHRPNKLNEERRSSIRWVNGSGETLPPAITDDGWRSERHTVGYKLVSLNHYALRSAEAFLVKRARGRANHASRTLGLNYWIRMDFNSQEERSMLRHLPRIKAEMDDLLRDRTLRGLHEKAIAWYRTRIAELQLVPEFSDMLAEIKALDLTDAQRIHLAMDIMRKGGT